MVLPEFWLCGEQIRNDSRGAVEELPSLEFVNQNGRSAMRLVKLICLLTLALPATGALAQTGKIAGIVRDASTGETLPGVNIIIDGTTQGAVTNMDGYYVILNVAPGRYDLRASFVGYTPVVQQDVRVNIDLTTEIDFLLQEEAVGMDEIVVAAERPVVQRDISANVANLNATEIENLPVASLDEVIGLQAGIEPGLTVRGSSESQVGFIVDGMSTRDGRDNSPFTGISYTSVDEVQVQTGGFNAEYGNIRSGLVSIVTKEGPRDRYTADVLMRYAPPQQRYFGSMPNAPNSYWMRPYVDDPDLPDDIDPAFVGTHSDESAWDPYLRRQYPFFRGWNKVYEEWHSDEDPSNDLTLEEFQELFDWHHRKNLNVTDPDYEVDASLGGPVPLLSRPLGDLRFFASYRQTQSAYILPSQRTAYQDHLGRIKLTSDIARGMKLTLQGMYSAQHGLTPSGQGFPEMWTGELPRYPWYSRDMVSRLDGGEGGDDIFAWHTDNPSDVYRNMVGADFTHTLGARTFYKVRLQRMFSDYNTHKPQVRDTDTIVRFIGPLAVDEAPFGFYAPNISSASGMNMGGHWGKARDSSEVTVWTGAFDLTSQVNRFMQVKGGVEYIYSLYDVSHAQVDSFFSNNWNPRYVWQREPHQGAAYAQTKFEFQGMVANLGLRADYWYPGGEWYVYSPFERAFSPTFGRDSIDTMLEQVPTERQFALSPRLGVSFPITEDSKLFFNYGHFRQMLNPHSLFAIRTVVTTAVDQIGNPNHPLPRTVAYELGYEQSLFNQYLLRLSGYYKALDRQAREVRYTNLDGRVDYGRFEPLNYADIRGFELTLSKNRGRYVRGFVNFTYMARKAGNFGFGRIFENRADQRQYVRDSRAHYQERPVSEPYARFNIEFLAPATFGPHLMGTNPLGDWRLSLLGEWRAGQVFTWTGEETIVGLENNVRWRDYTNLDLRLAKNFGVGSLERAQFFVDVTNVLNLRHLRRYDNWQGEFDWNFYMESLHLPGDVFGDHDAPYDFVPGDDRPGDFRKSGVAFVPIEVVRTLPEAGETRTMGRYGPLYYVGAEEAYYIWDAQGETFERADPDKVQQVLDDKAYIDMPNLEFLNFLNPRQVRLGMRITL